MHDSYCTKPMRMSDAEQSRAHLWGLGRGPDVKLHGERLDLQPALEHIAHEVFGLPGTCLPYVLLLQGPGQAVHLQAGKV